MPAKLPDDDSPDLPDFDPDALCIKCGSMIPEPTAPEVKLGPRGADGNPMQLPPAAPPPKQNPTTMYCNGNPCPWDEDDDPETIGEPEEHMHQWCDTCGFEWLSKPLNSLEKPKPVEPPAAPKIDFPKPPAVAPGGSGGAPAKKAAAVKSAPAKKVAPTK